MRRTNCPNCGHPIEHYYNYCCPACGTFLYNTEKNEMIEKIDTDKYEFAVVEVAIERSLFKDGYILILYCAAHPKISLTFQEKGVCTVDMPKRCGYSCEIDMRTMIDLYHRFHRRKL